MLLPHAHGGPALRGRIRQKPADFYVCELAPLKPSGEGEHLWVQIRKMDMTTEQVQKRLAAHTGLPLKAVSYAGLKDRHAVTDQWFSLHLPGQADPSWQEFEQKDLLILQSRRHERKLKRGFLAANRFRLVIRDVHGSKTAAENALDAIRCVGVPNYFGEQRFGFGGANVDRAVAWFQNRIKVKQRLKRSLYLSAARSFLFNDVLAYRVNQQVWSCALSGEVFMLNGSHSVFSAEPADEAIQRRLREADIHPTGPLYGKGESMTGAAVADLEERILGAHSIIKQGLRDAGLKQERRALRLMVYDLQWRWLHNNALSLSFTLPPGSYATTVIRELIGPFR